MQELKQMNIEDILSIELFLRISTPTEFFFMNHFINNVPQCRFSVMKRIPFEWNYVRLFASKEQKIAFNRFRSEYISNVITKPCMVNSSCRIEIAGSPPTSVASNADFNIEGKEVHGVIKDIIDNHFRYFTKPIDVIFDINIYGTIATIFQKSFRNASSHSSQAVMRQHLWAFVRVSQHLPLYLKQSILSEEDFLKHIECTKMIAKLGRTPDIRKYLVLVQKYLDHSSMPPNQINFEILAEQFSSSKYYENESYRSVGATLNVVNGQSKLSRNYLIDSLYDNFGFIVEILYDKRKCMIPIQERVMKTCKYIARMCHIVESLDPKRNDVILLKSFAEYLNKKRKKMMTLTSNDERKLLRFLGPVTQPLSVDAFCKNIYNKLLLL